MQLELITSLEPSARWYHPCGIYAPVTLIEVNPIHLKPNTIFITTPLIETEKATVNITAEITNIKNGLTYEVTLLTSNGKQLNKTNEKFKTA